MSSLKEASTIIDHFTDVYHLKHKIEVELLYSNRKQFIMHINKSHTYTFNSMYCIFYILYIYLTAINKYIKIEYDGV